MSNKHIRVEIGFGLEYDKAHYYLGNFDIILKQIFNAYLCRFGGYTFQEVKGGWRNPEGIITEEKGGSVFAYVEDTAVNRTAAYELAIFIRETLNQEAVTLSITPTEFQLV